MPAYLPAIENHIRTVVSAVCGVNDAMWPSILDVHSHRYPPGNHVPARVYRLIGAPRGSALYWDQPQLVCAYALAEATGRKQYAEAADAYLDAFLSRCVSESGLLQWGNHLYFDVVENQIVEFSGGHHELRPITPAWEVFHRRSAEVTERYIRTMAARHLYDPATGGFNRHDDGRKEHAFLESGGILAESLAWLAAQTADTESADLALRIARYNYNHRNPATGLVPNEPDKGRWDAHVTTSEIGLWAQSLLRAYRYTDTEAFLDIAADAVRAYLEYAYDEKSGHYAGQVSVETGEPVVPGETGHWPGTWADPWNTQQWPTHDYPMPLAEACLSLHAVTGDPVFLNGARNWARIVQRSLPPATGRNTYAENYGRCLHFLTRAGLEWNEPHLLESASQLADDAVGRLYCNGLFQGYPANNMYEAVDGVGFLLLALLYLETRNEPELYGFGF